MADGGTQGEEKELPKQYKKIGLYCFCGRQVRKGTMLQHFAKEHKQQFNKFRSSISHEPPEEEG